MDEVYSFNKETARSIIVFLEFSRVVFRPPHFFDADSLRHRTPMPEILDVEIALRVAFELQESIELLRLHDRLDLGQELSIFIRYIFYALFSFAAGELLDISGNGRSNEREA